jgi:hypothetical protein
VVARSPVIMPAAIRFLRAWGSVGGAGHHPLPPPPTPTLSHRALLTTAARAWGPRRQSPAPAPARTAPLQCRRRQPARHETFRRLACGAARPTECAAAHAQSLLDPGGGHQCTRAENTTPVVGPREATATTPAGGMSCRLCVLHECRHRKSASRRPAGALCTCRLRRIPSPASTRPRGGLRTWPAGPRCGTRGGTCPPCLRCRTQTESARTPPPLLPRPPATPPPPALTSHAPSLVLAASPASVRFNSFCSCSRVLQKSIGKVTVSAAHAATAAKAHRLAPALNVAHPLDSAAGAAMTGA